jgi:hypothetical protein
MKDKFVTLKSFLGKLSPRKGTEERENYWKLIGEKGKIIEGVEGDERVLVLFEKNLDDFKLENHNPIKNTLWISVADLRIEEE